MRLRSKQGSKLHPIWTGIGCAMLVLLPAIAWGLADLLVDFTFTQFPDLALNIARANPGGVNIIFIKIGAALILVILLYLIFSILSSLLYTILGGKEDAEIASRIGTGRQK